MISGHKHFVTMVVVKVSKRSLIGVERLRALEKDEGVGEGGREEKEKLFFSKLDCRHPPLLSSLPR
jgi:hypothetical protein